ncbi:hypothetical protein RAS1_20970 [Phycisphaerae bacterium RAS1]|nr:hypothetical protein RAS1_20970 [Phycisphaerae bacterium RAS1]
MNSLNQKLESLIVARCTAPATADVLPIAALAPPRSIEDILGGREWVGAFGRCWRVETSPSLAEPVSSTISIADRDGPRIEINPPGACIIDIETGGFSGTPVFLIGVLLFDATGPLIVQLLARDYPEEPAILRGLAAVIAGRSTWVTFNGKSFDEPFLRDRATAWRIELPPPASRVDVLHAARRRWRGELPDCRLKTLEESVLRRSRPADVPSSDIPLLFHAFFRSGNASPLRSVLEHNRADLVTTADLLTRLAQEPAAGPPPRPEFPAAAEKGVLF